MDPPSRGWDFTWFRSGVFKAGSLLVSAEWEEHFPDQVQKKILPKFLSGHFSICLETTKLERG